MATRKFVDLDLNFIANPATGDLPVQVNEKAIKNAVKNLILTKHYERPFHSEIGSSVNNILFDTPSYGMVAMLRDEIQTTINNFEPRVEVQDIQISFVPDNHEVGVTIIFNIINTQTPITVQFALERTR